MRARYSRRGSLAVVMFAALAAASPAGASPEQAAVNNCGKAINKATRKLIDGLQNVMIKCYARKHSCLTKPPAEQQACRDEANSHKDCSCETLGIDFPGSKAMKAADKAKLFIQKKCDAAFVPLMT